MPNRDGSAALAPHEADAEWQSIAHSLENVTARRIYRLRIKRHGRTAVFVVGEQDPFRVGGEQDTTGAELLTVAIFAANDGYVVSCRDPDNRWGSHIINIASDEVIDSEDFEG